MFARPPVSKVDEDFEDVGLQDEVAKPQPKKKSFLSRFSDNADDAPPPNPENKHHHFSILTGRKRGQSGTGSELGSMPGPTGKAQNDAIVR